MEGRKDVTESSLKVILCNGAELPETSTQTDFVIKLEYREGFPSRNINIQLPKFVRDVMRLPPRILDLLEIAGYIFAADRLVSRGSRDTLEYHNWARRIHFIVKVRDFDFWNDPRTGKKLADTLLFMTGDKEYNFSFQRGHSTNPMGLFDNSTFNLPRESSVSVILFSGGLDSLAGATELLENSNNIICLVSHRSGQPGTSKTQNNLYRSLRAVFHSRVRHYRFRCSLVSEFYRAVEETQRTRSFLYTSIAYAICNALNQSKFYIHENGVTSINFPRRQDAMNARTSRTTHPKTVAMLQDFFSLMQGSKIEIRTPFLFKTKVDVLKIFNKYNRQKLIPSAVSCSRTFLNIKQATHCGNCFQCIDRRLASFAAGLNEIDDVGIYNHDFIKDQNDAEAKTVLTDYIRQAMNFSQSTEDSFYHSYLNELIDIAEPISYLYPRLDEQTAISKLWQLCNRHGRAINKSLKRIQKLYAEPYERKTKDSLLDILAEQPYFEEPVNRLIESICEQIHRSIPELFKHNQPKNEEDFNDKVNALIMAQGPDYEREHPGIRFAMATAIPDHSFAAHDLVIEAKYIRGDTTPSKVSEGIAADITKYGSKDYQILFVVYDPGRAISNDDRFCRDFSSIGNYTVKIFR